MSIGSTLVCPRCKTENAPERGFCQSCGMGLRETGTVTRSSVWRSEDWIGTTIAGKYEVLSVLGDADLRGSGKDPLGGIAPDRVPLRWLSHVVEIGAILEVTAGHADLCRESAALTVTTWSNSESDS